MSADPSIDPSLARSPVDTSFDPQHAHIQPTELFYDATGDPTAFQLANAAIQGQNDAAIAAAAAAAAGIIPEPEEDTSQSEKKTPVKNKRAGPLIRKRSGWNAFYKEQFAIYHANNPPATKQNARQRTGFSSYAANEWKKLSPAAKEAYVQRASEDDALAVSRPVEKLRRKRVGLLDTLGRIIAELETEFGVETLVFWSEREVPQVQADGHTPSVNEGEAFGIVGSTIGSQYIEFLQNRQCGPHNFTAFVQSHQPSEEAQQNLLIAARKRKQSGDIDGFPTFVGEDIESLSHLKKKSKSNISRDYHDAEFRRLLLTLLNSHLPSQSQKTRLPRGFFGPYLQKHGLELVGLPEKPVEIGEGGKIGGWSADALRRNLEAVRSNRVQIRRIAGPHVQQLQNNHIELNAIANMDPEPEIAMEVPNNLPAHQEQEAARILAEGAGPRRVGRRAAK